MATDPIPLTVSSVVLPPTPLATPQDLADEIVRQLRQGVFMPTGYAFVVGGAMPTSDAGPWRPDGASALWWWDADYGTYFPEGPAVGTVEMIAHNTVPDGWVLCDGQLYNSSQYPRLFAVISQFWARTPDEATDFAASSQFRVPDFRSRFPVGANTGVDYALSLPLTGRIVGTMAGKERRLLEPDELPNPLNVRAYDYDAGQTRATPKLYGGIHYLDGSPSDPDAQGVPGIPSAQGNVPPFGAVNFIIRY